MRGDPYDELEVFSRNLRRARLARGWSQKRVALESGLAVGHLAKIERSERNPGVRTVAKITRGLEISAGELFKGIDGRP